MSFWSGLLNVGKTIGNVAVGAVTGGSVKVFNTNVDKMQGSIADKMLQAAQTNAANLQAQQTAAFAAQSAPAQSQPFDLGSLIKLPEVKVNGSVDTGSTLKTVGIIGGAVALLMLLTRKK